MNMTNIGYTEVLMQDYPIPIYIDHWADDVAWRCRDKPYPTERGVYRFCVTLWFLGIKS